MVVGNWWLLVAECFLNIARITYDLNSPFGETNVMGAYKHEKTLI